MPIALKRAEGGLKFWLQQRGQNLQNSCYVRKLGMAARHNHVYGRSNLDLDPAKELSGPMPYSRALHLTDSIEVL